MSEFLYILQRTWNFVHLFFAVVQTRSIRKVQEVSSRSDLWYTEKLIIVYFLLPSDFSLVNIHTAVWMALLKFIVYTSSWSKFHILCPRCFLDMLAILLPAFLYSCISINFWIFVYFQKQRGACQTLTSQRTQTEVYYMLERAGCAAQSSWNFYCKHQLFLFSADLHLDRAKCATRQH